jgi:putative hemolysin
MKKMIVIAALLMLASSASALRNPAAVYCEALGNAYVVERAAGGDTGYCLVRGNATKVDAWQFLQGKAAPKESYCAKKGYELRVVKDPQVCGKLLVPSCSVCVKGGMETEVTRLMGLTFEETVCGDGHCGFPEDYGNCPKDCPSGRFDSLCDGVRDGVCDPDCAAQNRTSADPDCAGGSARQTTLPETIPSKPPGGGGCLPMLLAPLSLAAALLGKALRAL